MVQEFLTQNLAKIDAIYIDNLLTGRSQMLDYLPSKGIKISHNQVSDLLRRD